jgi:hypothetical protein
MRTLAAILLGFAVTGQAYAQPGPPLVCHVEKKFDEERTYTRDELIKGKFSVEILREGAATLLRRCSFAPSAGRVTCDQYDADKVSTDSFAKIRKFYYFAGQFDVQVFADGTFIENNGRGSIAFGTCLSR